MSTIVSTSPQRPGDIVVETAAADRAAVEATVARARAAGRDWEDAGPAVRSAALTAAVAEFERDAGTLTDLIVREVGKPRQEAAAEVARAVAILRYYAQQAYDPAGENYPTGGGLAFTTRRARGVAGLVTPWNFPLAIPVWKLAPALAAGNGVVIKPAPEATAVAQRFAALLDRVLPAGLLAVTPGGAETGSALLDAVDVVSFTGSTTVGRIISVAAAQRGIPVQAEMGGLSATIVLPDADLDRAAQDVARAAMGYAGQKCTATKRIFVVGDPGPFTERLEAAITGLRVADPAESPDLGPVITEGARKQVLTAAAQAEAAGGRLLTTPYTEAADGWYLNPVIVDRIGPDAPLFHEEVFGPIAALAGVATVAEAFERANGTQFGLVTSVYTADLGAALTAVRRSESGMVKVNLPTNGVDFHLPFGGEKHSGYGEKEQGKAAVRFYTRERTVQVQA
ncbi:MULTISPECIES: aldehyde dehydrogenase family protein [unclassified Crossiella]|uniref:aldehyde dehydrogenase family protein n=1 Tax=unclassified Crossiella TaxID=2620835 RepID=UPI0020003B8B|nr:MULTISPECIES: aldehyde dehydrogenase family protein [unclassified Crossiella]MCK2239493.1 aldehyde dehydrogenase family protein [Crossiella sp. S99.2]MCK2252188.1 aldehyde dehydrogenase family protein [Crossiella sp. S99.1]